MSENGTCPCRSSCLRVCARGRMFQRARVCVGVHRMRILGGAELARTQTPHHPGDLHGSPLKRFCKTARTARTRMRTLRVRFQEQSGLLRHTPRGSRMSPLTPVRESAEKKGSAQSWMDRNAGTGTSVNGNSSGRGVSGGGGGREVSGEGGGRDVGGGGMALEATLSAPLTRYLPVASLDLSPARVH